MMGKNDAKTLQKKHYDNYILGQIVFDRFTNGVGSFHKKNLLG